MKVKYQKIDFPSKEEYPAYAEMYMQWVKKDNTLLHQLEEAMKETIRLVDSLSEQQLNLRYAPNKWSIKELLVHIIDDERIYGYRALAFARNDKTELPGFEQDDYANHSNASERSITNIMNEYIAVRESTITLFNGFSKDSLLRIGLANTNQTSVRALGYHILGHELHHVNMIKKVYLEQN
ncbi:DinB family protein [Maribacter sp. HTCC2170]|uniref:DinB family protein n=1 Tax=Maribacter sp. (strain HTCC2170 / KCCM 42371) TaxID=313603 RepID=UPI00006BD387|nr:DinB family protein [Maribacter sp. HTCC2170]EAR02492.1 hypothetical protein FB2170_04375 [Maribacter sp. HTCC2170]